ncbi:mitochondrial 54S ribosomal protein uL23m [Magnusiomyces paraingens]|uniref:Large ribosomal subunit protein uL23m n=1 Tax=Magnusiomyces paraingens TaxID=2606893 RepID=A0A5E8BUI8_9ASCO|nr:uncharacterized protein SAPINGB_P004450 [Saprochaete ingens]VVT55146.1 unnamed protein product [Saprochaete ingens]
MPRLMIRSAKRKAVAHPPPIFFPKVPLSQQIKKKEEAKLASKDSPVKTPLPPSKPKKQFAAGTRAPPKVSRASQGLARAREAIEKNEPHFHVGTKQIYFPTAKVVLLRPNAKHTPYQAKFAVPRYFNKLDLRDYLYHVYGLRALNVTTQLLWARWTRETPRSSRYRMSQIKKMTIDMIDPFVWPEEPSESLRNKMFNLENIIEMRKYFEDASQRFGADRNKEPTAFGGIVGPFPDPPQPFIPKYFKKYAEREKARAAYLTQKAEEEELVKKFLKL